MHEEAGQPNRSFKPGCSQFVSFGCLACTRLVQRRAAEPKRPCDVAQAPRRSSSLFHSRCSSTIIEDHNAV